MGMDFRGQLTKALEGTQIMAEVKRHNDQIEAEIEATGKRLQELNNLVRVTFWATEPHNQRSVRSMYNAYESAYQLAVIGGKDYDKAVVALQYARTNPRAYSEACSVMGIGVND